MVDNPIAAPVLAAPGGPPVLWRIGAGIGRIMVTIGALLLAFAAYQLWGTGLRETNAQAELSAVLTAQLDGSSAPAGPAPPASVPSVERTVLRVAAAPPAPVDEPNDAAVVGAPAAETAAPVEIGQPVASLRIASIGVDKTVVEGTSREALRSGPGHYVGTARPGHTGNVAIAGHRTTYGAPFRDIDQLQPGDAIEIETVEGVFTYRVEAQVAEDGTEVGHRIVAPEDVEVIAERGDNRLTLTACHPLYSARQRIVVTALLDGAPVAPPGPAQTAPAPAPASTPVPPTPVSYEPVGGGFPIATGVGHPSATLAATRTSTAPTVERLAMVADDDLGWQSRHAGPTLRWAMTTAAIALAAWVLGRIWRRWPAYAVASPAFALALLTCFANLDQLIPAA